MMTAILASNLALRRAAEALGRLLERLARAQAELPPDEWPRFPVF